MLLNLIRLVVVLWVVLEHLWFFRVHKIPHKVISAKLLPPLLTLNEPIQTQRLALKARRRREINRKAINYKID